jgi:hypothetical protein
VTLSAQFANHRLDGADSFVLLPREKCIVEMMQLCGLLVALADSSSATGGLC